MNTRPRVVGTPPPSTATQPEIDPMQLVRELLSPPPAPVAPPPTIMDKIAAIINPIAQGVSIGTSADPGRALQGQLQQQQQMKFQAEQAQRDRDEKLSLLNRQFGLGIVQSQIGEQQDIRKEKRVQGYKAEERKANEEEEIRRFAREKTGKEEMLNLGHEKALELARFNNLWEADKQQKGQEFQEAMTKLKENNDLLAKQVDLTLSFWTKGMSVGTAKAISEKILNGETLTPKEEKEMSRVIQLQEAKARRAASGGSSGGGVSFASAQKDAWRMAQEFAKNPPYILSDGSVVDATGLQTDIRGNKVPIGAQPVLDDNGKPVLDSNGQPKVKPLTIVRQMSPSEAAQYSMQTVFPAALGAMAPAGRVAKVDSATIKEPADAVAARHIDAFVANQRSQGMSDDQIINNLLNSSNNKTPQDLMFVEQGIVRNKLRKIKQGSVDKALGTGEGKVQNKIESKPGAFGRKF